jgi:hypothetical protein
MGLEGSGPDGRFCFAVSLACGGFFNMRLATPSIAPVLAVMTMVILLLPDLSMDPEIKEEFAAVRADLRSVDHRVREVDARVGEVDTRLSAELGRVETTLRQEIREEGIATRRHFDIVAESLRDDIRIIAEGLIALDAKVETIRDAG